MGGSLDILDITERRLLEDRLREALDRLRHAGEEGKRLLTMLIEAEERERSRIVRDIHDEPLQVMTAIRTRLSSLRQGRAVDLRKEIVELEDLMQDAIDRLRRVLLDVRTSGLDRLMLLPTLRARLDQMRSEADVQCALESRLQGEPPAEIRIVLLRIACEVLANIRKHAGATRVDVLLEPRDGGVRLRIRDDGKGFRPEEVAGRPGHLGLEVMRERAELAGGRLSVETEPGKGTTVECWIPRQREPALGE